MSYGLIGERLAHSFSPRIHALLGDYPYQLYPLAPDALPAFMRENCLSGFNVTIPYKQAVMPFLQSISTEARRIGAVNTVIRKADRSLHGDNTDYHGFLCMLGEAEAFRGQKALVLGSGGSSKTVQAVLRDAGCAPIVVISRSGEDNYQNLDRHQDARLLVNTTPVGMYPRVDEAPLDLQALPQLQLVLDLIYNPARTRLLLQAEQLGIPCRNGMLMLAAQAERAAELWGLVPEDGKRAPAIAARLSRESMNIALIGMPGCGKSAVGQALSKLSGRRLVDLDGLIEARAGRSIPELFQAGGEAAFRALETACLREAARESGTIIACGGGIVTRPENRDILRQNSRILWLKRELELLPLQGRPLSLGRGVEALYRERAPLYAAWAERSYHNQDLRSCALQIMEDLL